MSDDWNDSTTARLIEVQVRRQLEGSKRLTIGTLAVLVVANASAIIGLKGCIQEAAEGAAVRAAISHIDAADSIVHNRIDRLHTDVDDYRDTFNKDVNQVGGMVNTLRTEVDNAIRDVRRTKQDLDTIIKASTGLSEDQRTLVSDLLQNAQSSDFTEVARICGSRIDTYREECQSKTHELEASIAQQIASRELGLKIDSYTFDNLAHKPATTTKTVAFQGGVRSAVAVLIGYEIHYVGTGDKRLASEHIELGTRIAGNKVHVDISMGWNDGSRNYDDPFGGRVEFCVIAELGT